MLFDQWEFLNVRLDIWHFMRRFALGCTTEAHTLYGTFMSKMSNCIFEWDSEDLTELIKAKRSEMVKKGIHAPSENAVRKELTREELAKHCKRQTRGFEVTREAIEELILELTGATDSLGVKLLKRGIKAIGMSEQRHIHCIQDIPGIQLYAVVGNLKKGGHTLPIYRCARGSTSLESFHLHLPRFIPGTSANLVNFQAYILEGIFRWNTDRAIAALDTPLSSLRTFDIRLQSKVNKLSVMIHKREFLTQFLKPGQVRKEKLGVEYLLDENELILPTAEEDINTEIDEGFEDEPLEIESIMSFSIVSEEIQMIGPIVEEKEDENDSDSIDDDDSDDDESLDARGILGWDKVDALAQALIKLKGISVTTSQAKVIASLYKALPNYFKRALVYRVKMKKNTTGRFGRCKSSMGNVGIEAVKRCFLSAGCPASAPSKSRVVEAVCIHLCTNIQYPTRDPHYISRWRLILSEFNKIRKRLVNSEELLEGTELVLYNINQPTLTKWYKDSTRVEEVRQLLQGITLPPLVTSILPQTQPRKKPTAIPTLEELLEFEEPMDTTEQAVLRNKIPTSSVQTISTQQPIATNSSTSIKNIPKKSVSRTTEWRKRKREAEEVEEKMLHMSSVR